jgi:hypothetical protein
MAPPLLEPVEYVVERVSVKWIVQKQNQVAGRKAIVAYVAAHQPYVRTAPSYACFGKVVCSDRVQSGRNLDADDLSEWIFRRQ